MIRTVYDNNLIYNQRAMFFYGWACKYQHHSPLLLPLFRFNFRSSSLIQKLEKIFKIRTVYDNNLTTLFIQSKSLLSVFNVWACECGPFLLLPIAHRK